MNGPAPIILILTLVVALAAGAFSGSDPGLESIYSRSVGSSFTWHQEGAPIDRVLAVVLDQEGLKRLASEQVILKEMLDDVKINFETHALVVAYMGAMPTGGYTIRITDVQAFRDQQGQPSRVAIRLAVASPSPGSFVTQALTYPVDTVAIPRSNWPAGVLEALADGSLPIEASDQDGRDWGPVIVYASR